MMNKQEVIERLCALVDEVGDKLFKHQLSQDCFCGRNRWDEICSVNEGIIDFIENTVKGRVMCLNKFGDITLINNYLEKYKEKEKEDG